MARSELGRRNRTEELAEAFLQETRVDIERAVGQQADVPPRIRSVHDRAGHATPEFRTLAVPIPPGGEGASPAVLSRVIAQYARTKSPCAILLTLDALSEDAEGNPHSVLIAEARDDAGTRLFYVQPFRQVGPRIVWGEPQTGGWADPGEEEMILDAAFE